MSGISEKTFEEAIEKALLAGGGSFGDESEWVVREPSPTYGDTWQPGGYRKRSDREYDKLRCLCPQDVLDFVYGTQPKEWERLEQHYGKDVKERFLERLAHEIEKRGALDVLRNGVKDVGCKFQMLFFRPASGLNPDLQRLYHANLFAVSRQLHYSVKKEEEGRRKSLDMVLFVNGIPIFTAELKNRLTGQNVEDAIRQYQVTRDPAEPLFTFRRCLAHFAVDPDLVYVATRLEKEKTRFLPFNLGNRGGAGNPLVPMTQEGGYATAYLWESIWARDSVLELVQHFAHEVEEEDEEGRKTSRLKLIFPRYHQLDCVRRLVRDARDSGPGKRYLIQHSAGSGKSNSIAWLAHRLSVLHDGSDRRVFDSIIVITDRRVLDRQIQKTIRQFEQTEGVVENIDKTSRQLKKALEDGKTIIVTTLQKFPVIADEIEELPGKRFAIIIDEAHSSQSGESTRSLKAALTVETLEEAEAAEGGEPEDDEDRIVAEMRKRQFLRNASYFAFTATPKPKTLELFGSRRPDGKFEAFSLYSMRQAIEEGFIRDVLENYTTYKTYWRLLKKVETDPHYDRRKADYLLRKFVDLNEKTIEVKVDIIGEHFRRHVESRIAGRAKAMIVTRSRLHAVRYKQAMDAYLKKHVVTNKALVAFSGKVQDHFTEASLNGFGESQTAAMFRRPEYRFLIVAEKFQTGFDEPLLHTMYVDRKLAGVHAVQTLSRLNRMAPDKEETMVLDFANEAEEIQRAFQDFYEKTLLSEATDPNLLYDLERRLSGAGVFGKPEMAAFAEVFFVPQPAQDRIYSVLRPCVDRAEGLPAEERADFRGALTDYVRLYSFLSQLLTFTDAALERLYEFARLLRKYLPVEQAQLPIEIQQHIEIESYRVQQMRTVKLVLERGERELMPHGEKTPTVMVDEEREPLSRIIRELNKRFGTDFSEQDRVFIRNLEEKLLDHEALAASLKANTAENARLTFTHVVTDQLQDMVDTNFKFYKRLTDDEEFSRFFLDWLFERFRKNLKRP